MTKILVMKTYGNVILMTAISVVIFWVFMTIRPATAQSGVGCSSFFGPVACPSRSGPYRAINISPTTGRTYSREADYLTPKAQRNRKKATR